MSYFHLVTPDSAERPLLVEVPHAGLDIPNVVASEFCVSSVDALADSDPYVDKHFERAAHHGATLLTAKTSRYVIDLNRAPNDFSLSTTGASIKTDTPRGVLWSTSVDGRPLLREALTPTRAARRIELFHKPYHQVLGAQLQRLKRKFGYVILLAGHSMPSQNAGFPSSYQPRADIVPGWRGGRSAHVAVVEAIERYFTDCGLSVERDRPYQGGYTTEIYGNPQADCHAVQLEINRALYLDEETMQIKQKAFAELQQMLVGLVELLGVLQPPAPNN